MDDRRTPDLIAADLAPGDAGAAELDWSDLRAERVRSPEDPLFRPAYDRLWREFGARGEMEHETVIASRLDWDPARHVDGHAMLYEMLVVLRGKQIVAVRDHTAIVPYRDQGSPLIVHLSHVLIEPELRGSGLAGWLRAFPLQTVRQCAALAGRSSCGITLVAEMERFDPGSIATAIRLRSYGRAGFRTIDPEAISYCQPDFRDPGEIDRSSVHPVPLTLAVRRVGREDESTLPAAEVRAIVTALYAMFARHIRPDHMAPLWALLDRFPDGAQPIALQPPMPT